jgi:glucose uptake protein GlcU
MAFQIYYLNFNIAFLLIGVLVGWIGGSVGSGGEKYGFTEPYFEEVATGHEWQCDLWGISGGVVWNLANILLCKGISMMGNATGFPLCVGLGMVTGAIVGYVQDPKSNLAFLAPGVFIALCAICTVGLISYRKEQELAAKPDDSEDDTSKQGTTSSEDESGSGGDEEVAELDGVLGTVEEAAPDKEAAKKEPSPQGPGMMKKLVVCITGGLLLGLSNIGVGKATSAPCSLSPYANQTYFAVGVFLSSLIVIPVITSFPIEGGKGTPILQMLRGYCSIRLKYHLLAALGGVILCSGFFFFNLGNKPLSLTITYCIGQSAPLVGILWGTFFFREFTGTSWRVQGLVPVVLLLFASAIGLIAAAG